MMPLLRVEKLDAGYGAVQALWGVSLEVGQGEVVALIGANGAGKSTFLRVVSGLLQPWRGTVRFESRDITAYVPERIVRAGIAHVPQGRRLFSDLTVQQNLLLGAYVRRDRENIVADLGQMVRLFPSLADRLAIPASQLSGGEQQMLALARGLMARPRLLLIDEPSLGLAPLLVRELMGVVDRLRDEGVSVLLVEQDVAVALEHADRGYVLETGRIVLADTARALLANPAVQKAYLGLAAEPRP
jgi:ABC-type branched-subunit amino acid transport system ATPase component